SRMLAIPVAHEPVRRDETAQTRMGRQDNERLAITVSDLRASHGEPDVVLAGAVGAVAVEVQAAAVAREPARSVLWPVSGDVDRRWLAPRVGGGFPHGAPNALGPGPRR